MQQKPLHIRDSLTRWRRIDGDASPSAGSQGQAAADVLLGVSAQADVGADAPQEGTVTATHCDSYSVTLLDATESTSQGLRSTLQWVRHRPRGKRAAAPR